MPPGRRIGLPGGKIMKRNSIEYCLDAEAIVDEIQSYGGVMTLEDLASYEPVIREPVTGTYRGYQIISAPPASSGGTRIWPTVAQVISNVIDHGMDIQEAIDTARIWDNGGDSGINYESSGVNATAAEAMSALEAQGHVLTDKGEWNLYFGGAQGILFCEDGSIRGGADPRRDGKAMGF